MTSGDPGTVDGVTTRPAAVSDKTFLGDVFLRSLRQAITATRGEWNEGREAAQFHEQLDLTHTSVVRYRGTDVGFMMLRYQGTDVEIHTLCVAPEYQGQGIGTRVTQELVTAVRQRGRGIVLSVLKTNARAKALYERLGFVVIGESRQHYQMRFGEEGCQRAP